MKNIPPSEESYCVERNGVTFKKKVMPMVKKKKPLENNIQFWYERAKENYIPVFSERFITSTMQRRRIVMKHGGGGGLIVHKVELIPLVYSYFPKCLLRCSFARRNFLPACRQQLIGFSKSEWSCSKSPRK